MYEKLSNRLVATARTGQFLRALPRDHAGLALAVERLSGDVVAHREVPIADHVE